MYPDLIKPKAHPDLLQRPDYDPFGLIPHELPPAPRVFVTAERIDRAKARIAAGDRIDQHCLGLLLKNAAAGDPLPKATDSASAARAVNAGAGRALRQALALRLTGDEAWRDRALTTLRHMARAAELAAWSGHEGRTALNFAAAYDLLAADGLDPADDNLLRAGLWRMPGALDQLDHLHCNNHNIWAIMGRLAVGAALGHRAIMHDAIYGLQRDGKWRYGLVHQLRHDFLADGMQWEGSMAYHLLVLVGMFDTASVLENLGVDFWRTLLPAPMHDDGFDEHRGYGPKGFKSLQAAFDALLYQCFPNGDYSTLHDQILGNRRAVSGWAPVFAKAWEVYQDPRYAWLLHRVRDFGKQADGPSLWFHGAIADIEFVRLEERDLPQGAFSFADDARIGLTGRHVGGCSLFPDHGSTILRADPTREDGPAAYVYWGPHWSGHRSPAALHLDVHAGGERLTHAPHLYQRAYSEPLHQTWVRTTIAHNTVTVDERSMFPYDFETDSLWETDTWRDRLSDSRLLAFQTGDLFKAVRVLNDNVYEGVTLDRTVIVTRDLIADIYRATSDEVHTFDHALHSLGPIERPGGATDVNLGEARGYRHFENAWETMAPAESTSLPVAVRDARATLLVNAGGASGMRLIVANDPPIDDKKPGGDLHPPLPRTSVIRRVVGREALFASVWVIGGGEASLAVEGSPAGDVRLMVGLPDQRAITLGSPAFGGATCELG